MKIIDFDRFYTAPDKGVTYYRSNFVIPGTLIRMPLSIAELVRISGVTQKDLVHLNESDFRFKIFCARRSAFGAYGSTV